MRRDGRFVVLAFVAAVSCGGRAAYDIAPPPTNHDGSPPDGAPSVSTNPPATAECLTGDVFATPYGLSFDGRWFTFSENGVVVLLDRSTGSRTDLSRALSNVGSPFISGDGDRVLFGASVGNDMHAFVWDRTTNGMLATFLVGDDVEGALSQDGRFLAFHSNDASFAEPLLNSRGGSVVVDLSTNERWQASVSDGGEAADDFTRSSGMSDDGQRVVFRSYATNLVPGKPERRFDVYLHDHVTRKTVLAAASTTGGYADKATSDVRISGDGQFVIFESDASDIVPGDREGTDDVFTWDIEANTVTSFTLGRSNQFPIGLRSVSRDGRFILFGTRGDTFVAGDRNDGPDGFVYDRLLDRFELVTLSHDGSPLERGGSPIAMSGDGRVFAFQTQSPELHGDSGRFTTCFSVRGP